METAIAILVGILLFMILVIIHELGHFIAAKKSGVKVLEFGIGIPPKVLTFGKDKSGTEYTLNLIPLGGFVRLKGEDPNDEEEFTAKDSFISQKLWKKLIILVAGVSMNVIFAWIIFTILFFRGTLPIVTIPENAIPVENQSYIMPTNSFLKQEGFLEEENPDQSPQIQNMVPNMLGQEIGLATGDTILSINGTKTTNSNMNSLLKQSIGQKTTLTYEHNGVQNTSEFQCPEEECILGLVLTSNINIKPVKFGFIDSMKAGAHEIKAQTKLSFSLLGKLVGNLLSFEKEKVQKSVDKLAGPVGIVKMGEIILSQGIWQYIGFAGMISLALAIFNILPIPALDGGRALSMILQSVFRIKPQKYFAIENRFNLTFFILLMTFGVYIILKDLVRFWGIPIWGIG